MDCYTPEQRRAYNRAYYQRTKEAKRPLRRAINRRTRQRKRDWLWALKDKPCCDCGMKFPPYVMQFDHRPGEIKTGAVRVILHRKPVAAAEAEIEKCDLVCANCHAIRTHKRRNGS